MKKALLAIGIIALILGVLLTAFTLVSFPKTTSEAYQIPKSMVLIGCFGLLMDVAPTSKVADGLSLNAGDYLNIQVNVNSSKRIDFTVNNGSTTYLSYPNLTTVNINWTVPQNSSYNFVLISSSTFTSKDVHWQVTKQWSETAYRDVTQNVPLLPFQFFYLGLGVALSGLTIIVCGTRKRKISG